MIFLDPNNPNKYARLKRLLVPHSLTDINGELLTKQRFGRGDGSYVLAKELLFDANRVISYGVGDDPEGVSFEKEMSEVGHLIWAYDGSIDEFPSEALSLVPLAKEHLTEQNFAEHYDACFDAYPESRVIKMDIEGCEYDWLSPRNLDLLSTVDQFTVEVHSLIEEVPEGWELEPKFKDAKENPEKVEMFFRNLNRHFHLFHIHANNHSPRYVDFPDSLELSYVNRKLVSRACLDVMGVYPNPDLDEPNFDGRPDYVLDWWK